MRAAERTTLPVGLVAHLFAVAVLSSVLAASSAAIAQTGRTGGADEAYSYAAALFDKGFFERAASENQAFLQRFPDHPQAAMARWRLALSLFELKRFPEAARELDRLSAKARDFPFSAEVSFRRAQCDWELGRPEQAEKRFRALLSTHPDHELAPAARFWAGECAFKLGSFETAESDYQAVLVAKSAETLRRSSLYGLAWTQVQLEEWAEAESACRQFQESFPGDEAHGEIGYLHAESLEELGRLDEALAAYDAVRDGPYADDALLASAYLEAGRNLHQEAARRFGRLSKRMPQSPLAREAALHHGIERVCAGQYEQARNVLAASPSSKESAEDAERLYWLGLAVRRLDGPEAALRLIEKGLSLEPGKDLRQRLTAARADLLFDLGRFKEAAAGYEATGASRPRTRRAAALARLNAGDFEGARELIQPVVGENAPLDDDPQSWLILGEALFALGDDEAAEPALVRVTTLDGGETFAARAFSRLGWCRERLGHSADAREAFRAVLAREETGLLAADAAVMVARTSLEVDEPREAELILTKHGRLVAQSEKAADGLYYLAQARKQSGRLEDARDLLQDFSERFTSSPLLDRTLYELGSILESLGEKEEAVGVYTRLVADLPKSPLVARSLYAKAWCEFALSRFEDAAATAGQLPRRSDAGDLGPPAVELAAESSKRAGNAEAVEACYAFYIKHYTTDATAAEIGLRAALAWRAAERPEEAVRLLQKLLARHSDAPCAPRLMFELGSDLEDLGRPDEARRVFVLLERDHSTDPLSAEAAFREGELAYSRDDLEQATGCYERAATTSRDADLTARALYKLGWSRLKRDENEAASKAFSALTERCSESPLVGEALFLAGESLYRAERYDDAVGFFEKMRDEHAGHQLSGKNLFRLGLSLGHLERWKEARKSLEILRRAEPDFEQGAEADLWLGRSLAALGESKTALQVYERVLALDRGVLAARARIGMGVLRFESGDFEQALSEFLKVALLATTEAEISEGLYRAGLCLERTGERTKAADQYQGVIEKFPQSPFAARSRERLAALRGSM